MNNAWWLVAWRTESHDTIFVTADHEEFVNSIRTIFKTFYDRIFHLCTREPRQSVMLSKPTGTALVRCYAQRQGPART